MKFVAFDYTPVADKGFEPVSKHVDYELRSKEECEEEVELIENRWEELSRSGAFLTIVSIQIDLSIHEIDDKILSREILNQ